RDGIPGCRHRDGQLVLATVAAWGITHRSHLGVGNEALPPPFGGGSQFGDGRVSHRALPRRRRLRVAFPESAGARRGRVSAPRANVERTYLAANTARMATPPRKRRLSPQARRALELLAGNPRGATEDLLLLAHGFDCDMIAGLVYERLVTAKGESMK